MTEITFHFNVPEKLAYTCRLLRKAYTRGTPVAVLGEQHVLMQLDQLLWTFSALDFVPHTLLVQGSAEATQAAPIALLDSHTNAPHHHVLLNLLDTVPAGFEAFERLIEVVDEQPHERMAARERWRHYADRGYTLLRHDAAASAASLRKPDQGAAITPPPRHTSPS